MRLSIANQNFSALCFIIFHSLTSAWFYAIIKAEIYHPLCGGEDAYMSKEKENANFSRVRERINMAWSRICGAGRSRLACTEHNLRRDVAFLTALYFLILIWILCLKFNNPEMLAGNYRNLSELTLRERFLYDIVPFRTRQNHLLQWLEFFANALMFSPFGVFFGYLFAKKNIWRDLALCFGLSLSIEVLQLFSMLGGFATVDLIMNTLGYFVGLAFYQLLFKRLSTRASTWICRAFLLLFFPIAVYAAVGTVGQWELIVAILTRTL